jgi:hypothetical protein
MALAWFDVGNPSEEELLAQLDISHIPPEEFPHVGQSPEVQARLLLSYGLSARVRTDGRGSRLQESLDHGRAVIAFLGAKAYKKWWLRVPWFPLGVAKAGYHPVVVTHVESSLVPFRSRVFFHDPDPRGGGKDRSLRKGRHSVWSAGHTFEHSWGVWQGWMPVVGYLTLKMPDLQPAQQLRPWVFVEAWSLEPRDKGTL